MRVAIALLIPFFTSFVTNAATPTTLYTSMQRKGSYFELNYIQLTTMAAAAKVVTTVNTAIQTNLEIAQDPCDDPQGSQWLMQTSDIDVVKSVIASFRVSQSGYCSGAAHPTSEKNGMNFDLTTGTQAPLASLFKSGSTPQLDALLLAKGKTQTLPAGSPCTPDFYDQFNVTTGGYTINGTNKTITFWTQFPNAVQECNVETTVALATVSADFAPTGLAAKVLKH